jgi:hypothetical protein
VALVELLARHEWCNLGWATTAPDRRRSCASILYTLTTAAEYDNPAGRLHALLVRLGATERETSLLDAWGAVLKASADEVVGLLADVWALVGMVERAIEATGSEGHTRQVGRVSQEWRTAIFPSGRAFDLPAKDFIPSENAFDVLQATSEILHRDSPEGRALLDGELEDLRERLEGLIDDIKAADDLPESVKQLIVARLRDVIRAFDHVDIGGPNAVRFATEALAGAIDLGGNSLFTSNIRNRVVSTIVALYTVFGVPATVQTGIPAWEKTVHELMSSSPALVAGQREPASTASIPPANLLPPTLDGRLEP